MVDGGEAGDRWHVIVDGPIEPAIAAAAMHDAGVHGFDRGVRHPRPRQNPIYATWRPFRRTLACERCMIDWLTDVITESMQHEEHSLAVLNA